LPTLLLLFSGPPLTEFVSVCPLQFIDSISFQSREFDDLVKILRKIGLVWEVSFCGNVGQAHSFREVLESEGTEVHRVSKLHLELWVLNLQELASASNHLDLELFVQQVLHNEMAIKGSQVVGEDGVFFVTFVEKPTSEFFHHTARHWLSISWQFELGPISVLSHSAVSLVNTSFRHMGFEIEEYVFWISFDFSLVQPFDVALVVSRITKTSACPAVKLVAIMVSLVFLSPRQIDELVATFADEKLGAVPLLVDGKTLVIPEEPRAVRALLIIRRLTLGVFPMASGAFPRTEMALLVGKGLFTRLTIVPLR